jgi:hypothetical protein
VEYVYMNTTLWKKIPPDVMINNIMPYVYQTIDKTLLHDIKTFYSDFNKIINYYYFDMNEYCLLNDLIWFCGNQVIYGTLYNDYTNYSYIAYLNIINILDRNTIFSKLTMNDKIKYIRNHYHFDMMRNIHSKNIQIFGLMTPNERTEFIRLHIIDKD